MTETNPNTEQARTPSDVGEAYSMFQQDQKAAAAKQAEAETAAKAAEEKKPESPGPAEEGKEAAPGPAKAPSYKIVNDKGEAAPFVLTVDGKEIPVDDVEKLRTYAQLGYHGSQRGEELNAREKALQEKEAIVESIEQAMKDGRLIIKGVTKEEPPAAEADKAKEGEDVYIDPEVKKLKEEVARQREDLEKTQAIAVREAVDKVHKELTAEIEETRKEFPYARPKDVWDLLALQDEKTGKPLHNVKTAMETSHKEMVEFFEKLPLTEKQRQSVISTYVADKAKAEKAPVGAPAGAAPGSPGGANPEEKKKITSMADAIEQFKRDQAAGGSPPKF